MAERYDCAEKEGAALNGAITPTRPRRLSRPEALAKRLGLHLVTAEALTIARRRAGKGFAYLRPDGSVIKDKAEVRRLASLAVPPAYRDVRYAADPNAHLQAIGRDDAGRLQYRYHPPKRRRSRRRRRVPQPLAVSGPAPKAMRACAARAARRRC